MSVNNRLLFSEIFFKQIRRETADLANLRATLATMRDTWRYFCHPPKDWAGPRWQPDAPIDLNDGTALRDNVIQPIFGALELTYGPCNTGAALSPHLSPFFLYGDWAMQDRAGLCLVLPYAADIEGRDANGRIPKGRNTAQQLLRVLRDHDLEWGVLTNGRHWRLYHRTELSPTDTYLDLDLEQIVAADDIASYVIFHRFFSHSAFAQHDGRQRLSYYKQQSDQASKVIEDHLSSHVEEITRQLCQGLVESCRAAGEDVTAPDTRKAIYKNALYLVYRMLFVLYAEARDLLPLDVSAYRAVCLRGLLAEVRENHANGLHYADDHALWERLQKLFALIDQGDQLAGVPAYNGGLFDPGRRPFLTGHRIANAYLQAALIRLSTMPAKGLTYDQDRAPAPIDYRDMSVRHLGSLYEGLLGYNLFEVKDEPRVVRAGKKQTDYVPYSQAGKVRAGETVLKIGDVYFSETEGERKATGSYYTPEDVVDYIVRNTVLVKLAELKTDFYQTSGIERQLHDLADIPADLPAHRQIQRELDRQFVHFVSEQVLSLKILDMAMGSGHFLVNATHAIANFIVEFLNETPWENAAIDSDIATWRRRVAERCIFGVDLNELAVELAKLCLWMTTTAQGKPLTFLDHHLRWGNSLVGAWMKDVGVYPLAKKRGEPAFTLPLGTFQVALDQALAGYQELYALDSDDVEEVRQKARVYEQEIRPTLERYRELFDLHTGIHFGQKLDETTYAQLGAFVRVPEAWIRAKADPGSKESLEGWRDHHWFHWELEFPEVFARTAAGFDSIVGNPPYGRYGVLDQSERDFVRKAGLDFGSGDSSEAFADHAIHLASVAGFTSLIIPKSHTYVASWSGIRRTLIANDGLVALCDVSEAFQDVLLEQTVFCHAHPQAPREHSRVHLDQIMGIGQTRRVSLARHYFTEQYLPVAITSDGLKISEQMLRVSRPVSEYCAIWYGKGGATPHLNLQGNGIKVLRGREVGRYRIRTEEPQYSLPLEMCTEEEISRNAHRKIVAQDIVAHIQLPFPHIQLAATIDEDKRICLNTTTCFTVREHGYTLEAVLAVLNSRLIAWYVHRFIFNRAVRTMHFMPGYADRWPLRSIDFSSAPNDRIAVAQMCRNLVCAGNVADALNVLYSHGEGEARLVLLHDTISEITTIRLAGYNTELDNAIDSLVFHLYDISPTQASRICSGEV